jgi:hypothetical protein
MEKSDEHETKVFQEVRTAGPVSPVTTGTLIFDGASTRTINLRFVDPYPYPSDVTVNLRVAGGQWHSTKLACQ